MIAVGINFFTINKSIVTVFHNDRKNIRYTVVVCNCNSINTFGSYVAGIQRADIV